MTRMDHILKIGEPDKNPEIYLEDYAYTYLKRQQQGEGTKFYLYGHQEENQREHRLYIYGISDSPKGENSYFRGHFLLGQLKLMGEEKFLIGKRGQEIPLRGFYVFYAPNQAMQEYLVDTNTEKKEELNHRKAYGEYSEKRVAAGERLVRRLEERKRGSAVEWGSRAFYAGCVLVLLLLGVAVNGGNGYQQLFGLKQMVMQTMSRNTAGKDDFVVEEQRITGSYSFDEEIESEAEAMTEGISRTETEEALSEAENMDRQEISQTGETEEVTAQDVPEAQESESAEAEESEYEAYVVQEGDSLAGLCMTRYGNTEKIEEICSYNNITNENHIVPGQKLYLPK